jgi:hypothetical protein
VFVCVYMIRLFRFVSQICFVDAGNYQCSDASCIGFDLALFCIGWVFMFPTISFDSSLWRRIFDSVRRFVCPIHVFASCLPFLICRGELLFVSGGPVLWVHRGASEPCVLPCFNPACAHAQQDIIVSCSSIRPSIHPSVRPSVHSSDPSDPSVRFVSSIRLFDPFVRLYICPFVGLSTGPMWPIWTWKNKQDKLRIPKLI